MRWSERLFNHLEGFVGLFHVIAFGYCWIEGIRELAGL
jgi:hypothetical protein